MARLDFMAVRRAAVPARLLNPDEEEPPQETDAVRHKSNQFLSDC